MHPSAYGRARHNISTVIVRKFETDAFVDIWIQMQPTVPSFYSAWMEVKVRS